MTNKRIISVYNEEIQDYGLKYTVNIGIYETRVMNGAIKVLTTLNNRYKKIYVSRKGAYFNHNGAKFYLKDFKDI